MGKLRILIGILGLDQHEVGAIAVARMLRDAGMEVIYAGCFQTPEKLARSTIQEDVDVLGISCHSWEYLHFLPELMTRLKADGADAAVVVGGSVLTAGDAQTLQELGVAATFGPGSTPPEMIATIRELGARRASRLAETLA
jgi:methylmalonyl-CoA mutase C-terminal domain/subunit